MEVSRPLPSEYEAPTEDVESQDVVSDTTEHLPDAISRVLLEKGIAREAVEQFTTESEQPTELEIEKSHEVKSDQAQIPQPLQEPDTQAPVRIGAVISRLLSRQPGLASAVQGSAVEPDDEDTEAEGGTVPIALSRVQGVSLYRQAVWVGFTCAVLLLVFMMIFMVIF